MMVLFDITHEIFDLIYNLFLFQIIRSFLPFRGRLPIQIIAFLLLIPISDITIYLKDTINIVGLLIMFFIYIFAFTKGGALPKLSIIMILYPLVVATNYICLYSGRLAWYNLVGIDTNDTVLSSAIYMVSHLPRLFLWFFLWRFCKKRMDDFDNTINRKMWLILDSISGMVFINILMFFTYLPDTTQFNASNAVAGILSLISIITIIGCFYLIVYMVKAIRTDAQLHNLEVEYQYYEDRLKAEERVRALYHDMKNHLLLLKSADRNEGHHETGHDQARTEMTASLLRQIEDYEHYYHTGNAFLDIIVRDKAEKAKAHGIDLSAMLHFEEGRFIAPQDISTIFGNAFDNAIEASLKLPVSERLITAKANSHGGMLSIVIENNAAAVVNPKPDRFLHGFGLKNIRQAVEKYDGQCTDKLVDERFILSIIIPLR
ncbi:MAG: GHKL domain-containing protein [Lachnospiraceae bacterium]|jgi:hypothetical protein|nr:GHKL domain-containing protein [Lachnospiraceae bacterium]